METKQEILKCLIQEFDQKLKQSRFDLSNREYVVREYYRELRREIQLKKETENLETEMDENTLNKIEDLIDLIDPFEKTTLETFGKNSNNEFHLKLAEMENIYNNLIQNEADSHKVINDYIRKLRDLLSLLAFLRNELKSFLSQQKTE